MLTWCYRSVSWSWMDGFCAWEPGGSLSILHACGGFSEHGGVGLGVGAGVRG